MLARFWEKTWSNKSIAFWSQSETKDKNRDSTGSYSHCTIKILPSSISFRNETYYLVFSVETHLLGGWRWHGTVSAVKNQGNISFRGGRTCIILGIVRRTYALRNTNLVPQHTWYRSVAIIARLLPPGKPPCNGFSKDCSILFTKRSFLVVIITSFQICVRNRQQMRCWVIILVP